jgi:hypothetical protein
MFIDANKKDNSRPSVPLPQIKPILGLSERLQPPQQIPTAKTAAKTGINLDLIFDLLFKDH